jgi:hypothetical protein
MSEETKKTKRKNRFSRQYRLLKEIEYFLNDRKGFHIDSLDNDIRKVFLNDLYDIIVKIFPEENAEG